MAEVYDAHYAFVIGGVADVGNRRIGGCVASRRCGNYARGICLVNLMQYGVIGVYGSHLNAKAHVCNANVVFVLVRNKVIVAGINVIRIHEASTEVTVLEQTNERKSKMVVAHAGDALAVV